MSILHRLACVALAVGVAGCDRADAPMSTASAAPPGARAERAAAPVPASPAPATQTVTESTQYRELEWDELVPKDWDPMKGFRNAQTGILQDGSPEALEMMQKLREAWDNAPVNAALNGQAVRLAGYIVPLDQSPKGWREFLLVPYFGACIHTPPPPANQIVHVVAEKPMTGLRSMQAVSVRGIVSIRRDESFMGTSGYRMLGIDVEPYKPRKREIPRE